MNRNAKIALGLALALANAAACDQAPPTRAELVGSWVVAHGLESDKGAEMELLADGRVVLRHWPANWPADWLELDPTRHQSVSSRWEFNARGHHPHDPALFLEFSSVVDGVPWKSTHPIYWTSFLGTRKLEIGVRDPDVGLPQFEKVR